MLGKKVGLRVLVLAGLLLTAVAVAQENSPPSSAVPPSAALLGPQLLALEALGAPHIDLPEGAVDLPVEVQLPADTPPLEVALALVRAAGLSMGRNSVELQAGWDAPMDVQPLTQAEKDAQSQAFLDEQAAREARAAWNAQYAQSQAAWAAYYNSLRQQQLTRRRGPTHPAQRRFYELVDDPWATPGQIGNAMLDAFDEIDRETDNELRSLRSWRPTPTPSSPVFGRLPGWPGWAASVPSW